MLTVAPISTSRFGRVNRKKAPHYTYDPQHGFPYLGKCIIKMYVADFSDRVIPEYPEWHTVPVTKWIELYLYLKNSGQLENEKLTLENVLVGYWYTRLHKELALKIIFITTMQQCIYVTYRRKIPPWFSKRIKSVRNTKLIQEYFNKARRLLACILLYKDDDVSSNGKSLAVGHLLTKASLYDIATIYGNMNRTPKALDNLIRNKIRFKSEYELAQECKGYGERWPTIYEIVDQVRKLPSGQGFFKTVACQDYLLQMKEAFDLVLQNPWFWVRSLYTYGAINTTELKQLETKLSLVTKRPGQDARTINLGTRRGILPGQIRQQDKRPSVGGGPTPTSTPPEIIEPTSPRPGPSPPPPPPASTGASPSTGSGDANEVINELNSLGLKILANKLGKYAHLAPIRVIRKTKTTVEKIQDKIPDISNKSLKDAQKTINEAANKAASANDLDMQIVLMPLKGKLMGQSSFGSNIGLNQMMGFVKPYRNSMMEDYTGFSPRMYRNHINDNTVGDLDIPQANNYYGSYRLGANLDPGSGFGRKRNRNKDVFTDGKNYYQISNRTSRRSSKSRFGTHSSDDDFFF